MEKQVFKNLEMFQDFKNEEHPLFDRINATEVNEFLNNMMPGLTAHTFRTMKASSVFETELKHGAAGGSDPQELLDSYEEANWVVAKICKRAFQFFFKFCDSFWTRAAKNKRFENFRPINKNPPTLFSLQFTMEKSAKNEIWS